MPNRLNNFLHIGKTTSILPYIRLICIENDFLDTKNGWDTKTPISKSFESLLIEMQKMRVGIREVSKESPRSLGGLWCAYSLPKFSMDVYTFRHRRR